MPGMNNTVAEEPEELLDPKLVYLARRVRASATFVGLVPVALDEELCAHITSLAIHRHR